MKRRKKLPAPWRQGSEQPDRPGVYQRSYSPGQDALFSLWNGAAWGRTYETRAKAAAMPFEASLSQTMPWKQ